MMDVRAWVKPKKKKHTERASRRKMRCIAEVLCQGKDGGRAMSPQSFFAEEEEDTLAKPASS